MDAKDPGRVARLSVRPPAMQARMCGAPAAIALCIRRVALSKDGRGAWQAERALEQRLAVDGTPAVAADCAAGARRIGEWLRQLQLPPLAASTGRG